MVAGWCLVCLPQPRMPQDSRAGWVQVRRPRPGLEFPPRHSGRVVVSLRTQRPRAGSRSAVGRGREAQAEPGEHEASGPAPRVRSGSRRVPGAVTPAARRRRPPRPRLPSARAAHLAAARSSRPRAAVSVSVSASLGPSVSPSLRSQTQLPLARSLASPPGSRRPSGGPRWRRAGRGTQ